MANRKQLLIVGVSCLGIGFGVTMAIFLEQSWLDNSLIFNESVQLKKDDLVVKSNAEIDMPNKTNKLAKNSHLLSQEKFEDQKNMTDFQNIEQTMFEEEFFDPVAEWDSLVNEWHEKIDVHKNDSRDSDWAEETENHLWNGLEELSAANHFQIEDIDCRTSTCTALTRWSSRQAAKQSLGQLLNHDYHPDCGVDIVLDENTIEQNSYLATILVNCSA